MHFDVDKFDSVL